MRKVSDHKYEGASDDQINFARNHSVVVGDFHGLGTTNLAYATVHQPNATNLTQVGDYDKKYYKKDKKYYQAEKKYYMKYYHGGKYWGHRYYARPAGEP